MPKIFLDYGHGGNDSGTVGNGVLEKNIVLIIGKRVAYHLRRHSQTVIESRTTDVNPSLSDRSNLANSNNVDLSVSIHCNGFGDTSVKGFEIFTYGTGSREIGLAKSIHNQIKRNNLLYVDRGIKQENLHMVREIKTASVLVELGFITNDMDRKLILDNTEKFAIAITRGILDFYQMAYKSETFDKPNTDKLYRVQVGAYKDKNNALNMQKKLKGLGIESIIV